MSRWILHCGRIGPFPLRVHVGFLVLLSLFLAWSGTSGGRVRLTWNGTFLGIALLSLLVHELAHAVAARWRGIPVGFLLLGPLLNGTYLTHPPRRPADELWIALAGPLSNGLLAALLALGATLLPAPSTMASWIQVALWINLCMGIGNLIPAFPLDGARILRAFLGFQLPWLVASRLAVRVASLCALALPLVLLLIPEPIGGVPLWIVAFALMLALLGAGRRQGQSALIRELELQAARGTIPVPPPLQESLSGLDRLEEDAYQPLSPSAFRAWREICETALQRNLALSDGHPEAAPQESSPWHSPRPSVDSRESSP